MKPEDLRRALLKRIADVLEKLSVGALVVGLFQFDSYAMGLGTCSLLWSLFLTCLIEERK